MWVATETFIDADGDLIEAGRTFVSPRTDVYRMYPHRFERFTRSFGATSREMPVPEHLEEVAGIGGLTRLRGAEVEIEHGRQRRREPEPRRLSR
jgi:hypothetical protein